MTLEEDIAASRKTFGNKYRWLPEVIHRHQPAPDHPMIKRLSLDMKIKFDRFSARVDFIKKHGTYVDDEGYLVQFIVNDLPELQGDELKEAVRQELDKIVPLSKLFQLFDATVDQAEAFRNRLNMVRMQ